MLRFVSPSGNRSENICLDCLARYPSARFAKTNRLLRKVRNGRFQTRAIIALSPQSLAILGHARAQSKALDLDGIGNPPLEKVGANGGRFVANGVL